MTAQGVALFGGADVAGQFRQGVQHMDQNGGSVGC